MKLSPARVEKTLTQFPAHAIPDNHPVMPQLSELFGEHTFFLDPEGLNIVEEAESAHEDGHCKVVRVASWTDANRTSLSPHEPQPTNVVIALEGDEVDTKH